MKLPRSISHVAKAAQPPDPAVISEAILRSPWVLWVASEHPLAPRKVLSWDDLRNVTLVAASRDHEVSVAQMRSSAPNTSPIAPAQIVDNITTALGIAAQGLAATPAPAYVGVVARPLGLTMRRITKPGTVREVCLYRPSRRSIPPAAEAFAEFVIQWIRAWNLEAQHDKARLARKTPKETEFSSETLNSRPLSQSAANAPLPCIERNRR